LKAELVTIFIGRQKQSDLPYCIIRTYDEAISEVDRQVDLINC
jgi:hypothetical protein